MSKQYIAEKWLPVQWHSVAKAVYLRMLRSAVLIGGFDLSPPEKRQRKGVGESSHCSLVRNLSSSDEELAAEAMANDFDQVTDEVGRWKNLPKSRVREFRDNDGLVNEMALMYAVRKDFPLHYIVFKQVSSHLSHEGNTEQLFSRAGQLSDENGRMHPVRLSIWTSIGVNYAAYQPDTNAILARYLAKFSKNGILSPDDLNISNPDGGAEVNVE
jgi:hypothetical protein